MTLSTCTKPGSLTLVCLAALSTLGCGPSALVSTDTLPVRRVVVYRNGIAYFQRSGHVEEDEVRFKMKQTEVGDFLATLAVMERGGSSVRAAAFPLKVDDSDDMDVSPPPPKTEDQKRGLETVVLALDGKAHDLQVGYVAESPVWKPSYRLVVHSPGDADLQAWGVVENLSGEDWTDVKLTLIAGAPLAFRADLGNPVIPQRPTVTDNGEVIAAVPHGQTSLAQGDSFGAGGLGLSGVGEGGGGRGEGIGLGNFGGLGHGAGTGTGQGIGNGRGRLGGAHAVHGARLREGAITVNGRLPPEVVQRIVRQNTGRFRLCYENGLRSNPNLQGRVAVKFVIDRNGSVSMTADGGSDLPDQGVVQCVVQGFGNLTFPQPEGGMVTVVYPIMFASEEGAVDDAPASESSEAVSAPRNLSSLAAIGVEGGATRYDLPLPVTIPDKSATMVMLLSRPVSGEALFLFAPDDGVADSQSHPFRVGRFKNATPGLLERGPIAVFDEGTFLGQGMLDPLPAGATATVPFALERSIAVDVDHDSDETGQRVAKIENGDLTIERDRVTRTKYRLRNGGELPAKILVKHPRAQGSRLFSPPPGTEDNVGTGSALVPTTLPPRGTAELLVDERATEREMTDWFSPIADSAIQGFVADAKSDRAAVQKLTAAWVTRKDISDRRDERQKLQREYDDVRRASDEVRRNLSAIEKNKTADALRKKLTARLAETSAKVDDCNRKITELDSRLSELTVQFREAVRSIRFALP
jgi:hypothetical protein